MYFNHFGGGTFFNVTQLSHMCSPGKKGERHPIWVIVVECTSSSHSVVYNRATWSEPHILVGEVAFFCQQGEVDVFHCNLLFF